MHRSNTPWTNTRIQEFTNTHTDRQYARQADGLYWENEDGTSGGPDQQKRSHGLSKKATRREKSSPFHGYYFKILKGQVPLRDLAGSTS